MMTKERKYREREELEDMEYIEVIPPTEEDSRYFKAYFEAYRAQQKGEPLTAEQQEVLAEAAKWQQVRQVA
ncbi:MAG: hypothetical protein LBS63_04190 [Prevotellaceae bacterium]|jgi:hypothetical protein|nr:hypothetical protein [Prevotellaceae bacterium]